MSLKGPILIKGRSINHIVLLIHGYGSSGKNILSIAQQWNIDNTLFIAPNGHLIWEGGKDGYKWFDLSKDVINEFVIKEGLNQIRPIISDYINSLLKQYEVPFDKFVVAGFSQGAMIALDLLVSMPDLFRAVGFSGFYCPIFKTTQNADKKKVLLVHGTKDTVIPFVFMKQSEEVLKKLGVSVESVSCQGVDHSINEYALKAAEKFVHNAL